MEEWERRAEEVWNGHSEDQEKTMGFGKRVVAWIFPEFSEIDLFAVFFAFGPVIWLTRAAWWRGLLVTQADDLIGVILIVGIVVGVVVGNMAVKQVVARGASAAVFYVVAGILSVRSIWPSLQLAPQGWLQWGEQVIYWVVFIRSVLGYAWIRLSKNNEVMIKAFTNQMSERQAGGGEIVLAGVVAITGTAWLMDTGLAGGWSGAVLLGSYAAALAGTGYGKIRAMFFEHHGDSMVAGGKVM